MRRWGLKFRNGCERLLIVRRTWGSLWTGFFLLGTARADGEDAVDELIGDAKIISGREKTVEFGGGEICFDDGVLRQNGAKVATRGAGTLASLLDQFVRFDAGDFFGESHGYGLGENQAVSEFKILAHALWVELELRNRAGEMMQSASGEADDVRQGFPFGVPSAETAFLLLNHGGEHRADQRGHAHSGGQDDSGGYGIALVRHGGGTAAAVDRWFEEFADFGLHVERDVAGDLAERASAEAESCGDFGYAIAMAVPRKLRQGKLQLFGKICRDIETARAESRHRADCAAELKDETALLSFLQTGAMTIDGVEPAGDLYSESCGKRLLHPGAGGENDRAIFVCKNAEQGSEMIELGGDQSQSLAELKYAASIDGVLAGGAPMNVTGGFFVFLRYEQGELFDERNREIAGAGSGSREDGHVVEFGAAFGFDSGGREIRNESCPGFRARESGLEIEHRLQSGAVGKDFFNGLGAKQRIEQVHGLSVITLGME